MRRNYDTAYYRDLTHKIRERLPDAALGTDIIVGFPGETEAQFETSLAFFASLPLTYFHVFPYSVRRGTVAAQSPGHLPASIKKTRARRMRDLGNQKKSEFCRRFLGREVSVLVEDKMDKRTGLHRGFTPNYLPVIVRNGETVAVANREVRVRLTTSQEGWILGVPITVSAGEGHRVADRR